MWSSGLESRMPAERESVRTFATFLLGSRLDELAAENLRLSRAYDVPALERLGALPEAELLAMSRRTMKELLEGLLNDAPVAAVQERLSRWERGEEPELDMRVMEPLDILLGPAAQRGALLSQLEAFAATGGNAFAALTAVDRYYALVSREGAVAYERMRMTARRKEAEVERVESEVASRTIALRRALAQLDAAQRLAHVGSWAWQVGDEHYSWSPGMYALAGLRPEDGPLDDQALARLVHPEDLPRLMSAHASLKAAGEPYELTMRLRHAEGHPLYVRAIAEPARDEQGRVVGAFGAILDETERLQAESELRAQSAQIASQVEALKRADRYKDEFLGVISHELRTPLNFIMGFASLLEDEVPGPLNADQRRCVSQILTGADRMLAQVQDLLDTAQLQAGRVSLERESRRLDALLASVLESLEPLARSKGVSLRLEAPEGVTAWIDATRLSQVVTNLVENAIKFSPEGGRVEVSLASGPDRARVAVSDEGPGIPEPERERIFERFHQLDMSPTREAGGVGLGLAIARALVEAHGGSLCVEAAAPRGSRFVFEIPAQA